MSARIIADDAIRQDLAMNVPGTNVTLHGPYITFHFADAPDETYVLAAGIGLWDMGEGE